MIKKDDIFLATEGGKTVIVHYYPQASACFGGRGKNFKIREDDRNPSATVFEKDGVWFLQDKGGSDNKAYTAIQLVQREQHLSFAQAIDWIAAKFAPHLCGEKVVSTKPQPKMEEVKAQDMISVQHRSLVSSARRSWISWDIRSLRSCARICTWSRWTPISQLRTRRVRAIRSPARRITLSSTTTTAHGVRYTSLWVISDSSM